MKIFYNPKCSTCRNTLELLREKGIEPEIVEYLKTPPSRAELENVISLLGIRPLELVRVKEPVWKEKYAGKNLSDSQVTDVLGSFPVRRQWCAAHIPKRGSGAVIDFTLYTARFR